MPKIHILNVGPITFLSSLYIQILLSTSEDGVANYVIRKYGVARAMNRALHHVLLKVIEFKKNSG